MKDAIDFLGEDPALGFERIIGVEFAAELVEVARANVLKLQICNTSVVHTDAAEFDFEARDMVVYLYHPFFAPVKEAVLRKLEVTRSRPLYVEYKNAVCAPLLDECRFLRPLGDPAGQAVEGMDTRERARAVNPLPYPSRRALRHRRRAHRRQAS